MMNSISLNGKRKAVHVHGIRARSSRKEQNHKCVYFKDFEIVCDIWIKSIPVKTTISLSCLPQDFDIAPLPSNVPITTVFGRSPTQSGGFGNLRNISQDALRSADDSNKLSSRTTSPIKPSFHGAEGQHYVPGQPPKAPDRWHLSYFNGHNFAVTSLRQVSFNLAVDEYTVTKWAG